MGKVLVHIDMDDTIVDYRGGFQAAIEANPSMPYPQATWGFWENLEPIEGARECAQELMKHPIYEPYLLTAPSVENPWCYTGKRIWVEKHLGMEFCKRLIITENKGLVRGDYLIDDYVEGKGQESFEGRLIHYGSDAFPDWKAVMAFLRSEVSP